MQAPEEPLRNVAYLTDGTLEGLLSAVFLAYQRHEDPIDIISESRYEPRLGQSTIPVYTDFARAERVRHGIERAAGRRTFDAVVRASTCDDYDAGVIILRFIRHVMKRDPGQRGAPVLNDIARPEVDDLLRLAKHAVNESEKMRQFIRFSQLENGIWFARCNPNASVIPLVMGHFAARLNDQPFIIYDENHNLAGVYDTRRWQLVSSDVISVPRPTEHDDMMQEAWKRFYDTLSVDARYNPELRRHFMPVRLWTNLPEMKQC